MGGALFRIGIFQIQQPRHALELGILQILVLIQQCGNYQLLECFPFQTEHNYMIVNKKCLLLIMLQKIQNGVQ